MEVAAGVIRWSAAVCKAPAAAHTNIQDASNSSRTVVAVPYAAAGLRHSRAPRNSPLPILFQKRADQFIESLWCFRVNPVPGFFDCRQLRVRKAGLDEIKIVGADVI